VGLCCRLHVPEPCSLRRESAVAPRHRARMYGPWLLRAKARGGR
jgi:hypothetical protein